MFNQNNRNFAFYFTKERIKNSYAGFFHRISNNIWQLSLRAGLLMVFIFAFQGVFAQRDVIITQAGEPIRCMILDESPNRFVFVYIDKNGKMQKNEIFKSLIKDFKYDYYPNDILDAKGKTVIVSKEKPKRPSESPKASVEKNAKENMPQESQMKESKIKTEPPTKPIIEQKPPSKQVIEPPIPARKHPIPRPSSEHLPEKETTNKPIIEDTKKSTPIENPQKTTKSKIDDDTLNLDKYPKFSVGARAGFASLLNTVIVTNDYTKYQQGLEKSLFFGADFVYFPTKNFGFGIMYTNFLANNSAQAIKFSSIIDPGTTDLIGDVKDKISSKFLGIPLLFRIGIGTKVFLTMAAAPGLNFYSDKRSEGYYSINRKGQQVGAAANVGFDFLLGKKGLGRDIMLCLEAGYNYAKYDKLNSGANTLVLSTPLDYSHWSVTVGLRFARFPKYFRLATY